VLIEAAPKTIDPRFAVAAYETKLSQLVYAPLVSVDDPELKPKMELAESVERRSPTEYLATLREGARFSDGRPVTADDVVYTVENIRRTATNSLRLRFVDDGLERAEAIDGRHVRFTLAHPHAPFLTDLDFGILARPAPGHELDPPVGAGAFVPVAGASDRFRFRPNPHYLFGAPRVQRLTVKVIGDDNSRLLALVGGSGDLTQNTVSPLLLDAVEAQPRLKVMHARSSVYTYMGLNCDDPALGDARVRRAIAYAIDRRRIVATKFGGGAVLSTGMLPPFHWAYACPADGVIDYPYDPARARQLLDEAGYRDPGGGRPRLTLVYKTSSNRFRVAVAQVIAAQLAEVGIEVDLRPLEFSTFFADVKAGNFQIFTMQLPEVAEPDLYVNFFSSGRIPTRENPDRGSNRVRYRNPEVDRWLAKGQRDLDPDERRADYREVQRLLARDVPVISLWHEDNVAVMGRQVQGYDMLPTAHLTALARTYKLKPSP
jgi:peptide/nickel transport system substrate-binding protein